MTHSGPGWLTSSPSRQLASARPCPASCGPWRSSSSRRPLLCGGSCCARRWMPWAVPWRYRCRWFFLVVFHLFKRKNGCMLSDVDLCWFFVFRWFWFLLEHSSWFKTFFFDVGQFGNDERGGLWASEHSETVDMGEKTFSSHVAPVWILYWNKWGEEEWANPSKSLKIQFYVWCHLVLLLKKSVCFQLSFEVIFGVWTIIAV